MSFSAFDPPIEPTSEPNPEHEPNFQPAMTDPPAEQVSSGYDPVPESAFPVEQLSLAQLFGVLLRRPAGAIAGLQEAVARSSAARREAQYTRVVPDWTADQNALDTADRDLTSRRVTAPRGSNPFGAFTNAARRGGTALTPALQGAGGSPVAAGTGDLTALLGSTSLAILTVPQRTSAEASSAVFTRANLIALAGMAIGCLMTVFGVIFALRNGSNYDEALKDIFPTATWSVGVGIALFAAFGVRLMREAGLLAHPKPPMFDVVRLSIRGWLNVHWLSVIAGGIALVLTGGAWAFNAHNTFTTGGVVCWLLSIFFWWAAFDPALLGFRWLRRGIVWIFTLPSHLLLIRTSWSAVALIAILVVGGYVRLHELAAYPPDTTSDAVEMVLDTQRVAEGARPVFLPTNGGRESSEPYIYVAILHNIFGVPIDYNGLKLLNGIEGIFTILAVYWLARALFDDPNQSFGNLVGLIAAGLVSVSYWDIVLSRMAERIVLAPIAVCFVCVYFIKAVRYNRLQDYVRCGLAFGVGLYTYQSLRILPIMFVICMIITLIMRVRHWKTLRRYVLYSVALVVVALAVFMPLARYAVEYPDYFWSRTYGRLFGQDNGVVTVKDPQGGPDITRPATFQDQVNALGSNVAVLGSNTLKATLMFTWAGDRSWFTGTNAGKAEMDELTGALFLIGVALWIVRLAVRRDPGDWVVPMTIFAGLLATALALAFTVEVPSATRGSNALPFAYILAAFAAALIVRQIWRTFPGWSGILLTGLVVVLGAQAIGTANVNRYVLDAMPDYRNSTLPHAQAGQILKDFGALYGTGNAFVISYPYWWDHRALAISADSLRWADNNGLLRDNGATPPVLTYQENLTEAAKRNFGTAYELRANRPLLFFINQQDQEVVNSLLSWLPPGTTVEHVAAFKPDADFILVLSAPVDCTWLNLHLAPTEISQDCLAAPIATPAAVTGG